MNHEVLRVLGNWTATSHGAEAVRVVSPQSFSGAAVWRVEAGGQAYALRRWQEGMDAGRLQCIHAFQTQIAESGPTVVPVLEPTRSGPTIASSDGLLWELASWRPGLADFHSNPQPQRLSAAMRTLAAIHDAVGREPALSWKMHPQGATIHAEFALPRRRSASVSQRADRLERIVGGDLKRAMSEWTAATGDEQRLGNEALSLVGKLAPVENLKTLHWRMVDLPLQWRLGDVHHDHILFTGDEVTGVVDFGAVDYDSPAGDVARLLGSLVGDDADLRRQGLAAYQQVRLLSSEEVAAVDFFDSTGTVIAAANWIEWLWGAPEKRLPISRNEAAIERLAWLVKRLRALAARAP